MPSAFSDILDGSKTCHRILEDHEFLAFLSETPVREGHTLVIPRQEVDAWFEMEDDLLARLMVFAKKTAGMLRRAVPCAKIGLMIAGIQVRHVHLHLVPIDLPADLDFSKARSVSAGELERLAERINRYRVQDLSPEPGTSQGPR